jgi:Ca2+-transporting ATPase
MVFLALGAWRIAKRGVLTRRMPAIEMLGAATVLCVDKTGTLTENRMALASVLGDNRAHITEAAALACEPDAFDPMERAILDAASPATLAMRREWTLELDYPFGGDFLAVCHAWRSPQGQRRIVIKGAPETVLPLCHGGDAAQASEQVEAAAARGLRLLAVAETDQTTGPLPADARELRFRWLGFVALADPLRAEVPAAVAQCRRAGIRVVMITGDYPGTALAIAQQAGIAVADGVLTGAQIRAMDDARFAAAIQHADVFARILPEEKLRLVQALKAAGEVVAMTGDGVNDAPALKAAHIGIAMGRRGTDVAREAAALVLTGDDFGSIVATVSLGRRIYENIRNAMHYLIAVHVPIAGAAFVPIVFGWPPLLLPVHVVFLEFVIDPACSVAFEAEDSDAEAMLRPPRDPRARLFGATTLAGAFGAGACMLATLLAAGGWAVATGHSDEVVRAVSFATIVFGNIGLILTSRSSERSLLQTLWRPNAALWWVIGGAIAALAAAIYWPPAAEVFRFAPLGPPELAVALGAAALGIILIEGGKLARRR